MKMHAGTGRMFRRIASSQGLTFSFVNAQDAKNVADALQPNTKVRHTCYLPVRWYNRLFISAGVD